MKTTIHNKRLIKFAEHLMSKNRLPDEGSYEEVRIVAIIGEEKISYMMKYPHWVFDELVAIFPEWEFDEMDDSPVLMDKNESINTFYDVCTFFELEIDEISIFDLDGFQMPGRFGGKILNLESTTQDVAYNIIGLVKSRILGYQKE